MRFLPVLAAAVLSMGAITIAVPAASVAATAPEATSENWAGYVASAPTGASFSRVNGSWVQPSADASAGDGYSAFWVGLGGDGQSQSLEQIGTQADVVNGQTVYYAWYELVPSAPVKLGLAVYPGDHISASVAVSGSDVTVSLSDQSAGSSFTRTIQMSDPDTSSAEWIAEAPSAVYGDGGTQTLPLANFGTVNFTGATATADGQTGTISNWTSQPVQLSGSDAGAQPAGLSSDGSSFSVAWQGSAAGSSAGDPYSGGDPYSYGYGYGGYAPPGYAYGY